MLALGGTLKASTTLISPDGSNIFVACGPTVRVYSALTGHRLLTLEGHAADVTAICAHHKNKGLVRRSQLLGVTCMVQRSASTAAYLQRCSRLARLLGLCCRLAVGGLLFHPPCHCLQVH